jgi:hypothetical protein
MLWRFECYNGTIWEACTQMLLSEAIIKFKKVTGLSEQDIKRVINLH